MAITEQFFIDPGTEMIPTPPIHLQGFDLDQFVRHLHIFTGRSTRSKTVAHDPLLSHTVRGTVLRKGLHHGEHLITSIAL
jgi:hypothetical protein